MANDHEILEPKAKNALEKLKIRVADETLGREMEQQVTAENYDSVLDQKKYEVAEELGLKEKIEQVGWENMTTKEVGKIGGHMGGKIGGNMVKKLISMAEAQMAPVADEAVDKKAVLDNNDE
ncbi:small, acid-soluble spore protein, alpha/beta type [Sporolituus thermophilus]|uniref:Small, acid-soluble spore protein, alpha/beta type n=1 Tax=Sporolituus thermophilus DSM 23256 TaxID=1123285 RepID=A0A1G7JGT2_9FIRM|nr:small, acid-soluble spore protein, alpha/beta type [Sporolituus thermophilus]SDF24162.1 Small, acid-soluble spore protein, alpha/beta type [Sporolituus thermophilus DSM 23256]